MAVSGGIVIPPVLAAVPLLPRALPCVKMSRVRRQWFLALDTVRLRSALRGVVRRGIEHALEPAAAAAGVRILDAVVVPFGVRAVVDARSREVLRAFARRVVAFGPRASHCDARLDVKIAWRPRFYAANLLPHEMRAACAYLRRARSLDLEVTMSSSAATRRAKGVKGLVPMLRRIDELVDAQLGADEAARRIRRYVADHDAPSDDTT